MYFEKISRDAWVEYVTNIMTASKAPVEVIDEQIDAWNDIKLPRRATAGSAGYDFYAPTDIMIPPGLNAVIPTGIKVNLESDEDPDGLYVLQIYPRSSLGFKYNMTLANTVGIIDKDYFNNKKNEGHILISCINGMSFEGCPMKQVPDIRSGRKVTTIDLEHPETQSRFIKIDKGTAFAQGLIIKVYRTKDDSPVAEEREGGIGSTNSNQ